MDNTQTQGNTVVVGDSPAVFAAYKEVERISFVRPYSPTVQAIPLFRHAVIRYRITGTNKVERPAQMVTVPQVQLGDDYLMPEKAQQVFIGQIEDQQDVMLRNQLDEKASVIHWDSISLDATLDALTAVRVSNRLTREQIEAWAKIAIAEVCKQRGEQVAKEKGTDAAKQIAGTTNAYVSRFGALAAAVPNLGTAEATSLKNMLTLAKLDDDMAKALSRKLTAILEPKIADDL